MGRPKEHGERTRTALLDAAEYLVSEGGADALSVRAVADTAGTTTRAVYSIFGSRDGLIATVAARAFDILAAGEDRLARTDDPAADLITVGTDIFRVLACDRPGLYRIAFQRVAGLHSEPTLVAARSRAYEGLLELVQRVKDSGALPDRSVPDAALEFNAMLEGLANAELRGEVLRMLPAGQERQAWQRGLETVLRGWTTR